MKHLVFVVLVACGGKTAAPPPPPTSTAPPPTAGAADCVCTEEYNPVCGADGKTYGNACAAGCAKVAIKAPGACS